ncbi:MAG: glycerophosphodiester phosphodiesterase family protein [Chitinophagaceae bacterium]|nr:MAG: glycerophosphodiester phosphodiesterase family protein [Chitinophagaceae bacterium]
MQKLLLLLFVIGFISCQQIIEAPMPNLKWAEFDSPEAKPLTSDERKALEGVYLVGDAADDFGKEAALKWTYVAAEKDTTYYLSFFCAEDVRYFICQGKRKDSNILLNGYWRNVENTKIGKAYFTIPAKDMGGAGSNAAAHQQLSLGISGMYGFGDDEPHKKVSFRYNRPLNSDSTYMIVAHRGGGRNNDLLPASENSVQMIPLAAQLGARGIEIDIQLTKDKVPVLFHDANVNDRLTTKTGIHGPISDYTSTELDKEVKLKRGGKVPTLKQALDTVLYRTPLEFVWLDCKYKEGMPLIHALQKEYMQKATQMGRKLTIIIGVPDEEVMAGFQQLPDYKNIPSLCELDIAKAAQINANIWAPSWTKGHQTEEVDAVHARGKKAIVWTVDVPDKIKEFMYEAKFDGMVTNRPTMAAYYLYSRQ